MLRLALALLPLVAGLIRPPMMLKVSISKGAPSDVGVIWEGDETAGEHFESLVALLKPGADTTQDTFPHHAFTLRSSDMNFRVRVTLLDALMNDPHNRPFRMTFLNLNHDGKPGSGVEMTHHDSGHASNKGHYWIESGLSITHATGPNHIFTLSDANRNAICDLMFVGGMMESSSSFARAKKRNRPTHS